MKSFFAGILVAALGWAAFQYIGGNGSHMDSGAPDIERLRTVEATRKDIKFEINLAGEISPADIVSVRPEVNGKISELPVDISDVVKKGDLLFALDDRDLMIELESRQTEIEAGRLQLEQALRLFERQKDLFKENLVSREEYENSNTAYKLAENRIERAQKDLALTQDRLSRTRITAPFDGTILTRAVALGQAVSGSGGFNSGTEVMTIADLNQMMILAHVNQVDVTRLRANMAVVIEIEAVNGLKVNGVIDRIAPQATIKSRTKGFETRIRLTEINPIVQPGMTANIVIPIAASENVVAVPLSAVFTEFNANTKEMERFVYVKQDDGYLWTPVKIGIADYSFVEILEGLSGGEQVCLEKPQPEEILTPASNSDS